MPPLTVTKQAIYHGLTENSIYPPDSLEIFQAIIFVTNMEFVNDVFPNQSSL